MGHFICDDRGKVFTTFNLSDSRLFNRYKRVVLIGRNWDFGYEQCDANFKSPTFLRFLFRYPFIKTTRRHILEGERDGVNNGTKENSRVDGYDWIDSCIGDMTFILCKVYLISLHPLDKYGGQYKEVARVKTTRLLPLILCLCSKMKFHIHGTIV